jgi:alpha-1,2-mannosyltransferase
MLDLSVYRVGSLALLNGQDIYRVSEPSSGLPFTYPVFAALAFTPFAVVPLWAARVAMLIVSLLALLLICRLSLKEGLGWSRTELRTRAVPIALLAVGLHPVLDTLIFGQINLILVAMIMWDTLATGARRRGILIGIAAGIKLTPGLFIIYFLVTGQRRAAWQAAGAFAATVLIGLIVQPGPAWTYWTHYIFDPARTGNVIYSGNQSILATVSRLLRDTSPPYALVATISAACVILAIVTARSLYFRCGELAAVCVVAVAILLVSPISWTHHWVWCVPCFAVLLAHLKRRGWPPRYPVSRIAGLTAGMLIVALGITRFVPVNGDRELTHHPVQQLMANSFAVLAVLFLVWGAVHAYRLRTMLASLAETSRVPG